MLLLLPTIIAYVQQVRPAWRREICQAYRERDAEKARSLIQTDFSESLSHLAELVGAADILRPLTSS